MESRKGQRRRRKTKKSERARWRAQLIRAYHRVRNYSVRLICWATVSFYRRRYTCGRIARVCLTRPINVRRLLKKKKKKITPSDRPFASPVMREACRDERRI